MATDDDDTLRTGVDELLRRELEWLAGLLAERTAALAEANATIEALRRETAICRRVALAADKAHDELADLATERWRTIRNLEARCESLQRQVLDLAVKL